VLIRLADSGTAGCGSAGTERMGRAFWSSKFNRFGFL
jgi:hypothetical protein